MNLMTMIETHTYVATAMLLLIPTQFENAKAFKVALDSKDSLIGEVRLAADWMIDGKSFDLHGIRYDALVYSESDGVLLITASRLKDS